MTEVITISIPLKLRKMIDTERGLIPRSRYIVQKLETTLSEYHTQNQENFDSSDSITYSKQEEESNESTAST